MTPKEIEEKLEEHWHLLNSRTRGANESTRGAVKRRMLRSLGRILYPDGDSHGISGSISFIETACVYQKVFGLKLIIKFEDAGPRIHYRLK